MDKFIPTHPIYLQVNIAGYNGKNRTDIQLKITQFSLGNILFSKINIRSSIHIYNDFNHIMSKN